MNISDIKVLINLVREKPELYDHKYPKYNDRDYVTKSWMEICQALNKTYKQVRSKWHCLRSNYVREIRKLKSDSDYSLKLTWQHFDAMGFLKPLIKVKTYSRGLPTDTFNDSSNCDEPLDAGEPEDENAYQPENGHAYEPQIAIEIAPTNVDPSGSEYETISNGGETKAKSDTTWQSTKRRKRIFETEECLEHKMKVTKTGDDDQDFLFLRSILPSIKQLSPLQNLEFKSEVIDLLKKKLYPNSHRH